MIRAFIVSIFGFLVIGATSANALTQVEPVPPAVVIHEDFTRRYDGYVIEETLTRDVVSDEDSRLLAAHFAFLRAGKDQPTSPVMASGIDAIKTDGMHLMVVVRFPQHSGTKPDEWVVGDPAVTSGLIKVLAIRPFQLDPPFDIER